MVGCGGGYSGKCLIWLGGETSTGNTMTSMLAILTVVVPGVLVATPPVPFFDSIEPAFGEIGSEITINGSNFSRKRPLSTINYFS